MRRNIAAAIFIFMLITGIAVLIARAPNKASPPDMPVTAHAPASIRLDPSGDFTPRATAPAFKIHAPDLKSAYLRFYRLRDRALMLRLYRGITQGSLSPIAIARLLADTTTPDTTTWIHLKNGARDVAWPDLGIEGAMPSGFYLLTVAADPETDAQAASWFIRSDLHIVALHDVDGWHALCLDLHARQTIAKLAWFGFDTTPILADDRCSPANQIPPAAKIPTDAPLQLLFGEDASGNLAFVPLRNVQKAAPDPAAGNLLATERGHYQQGQTVMALAYGPALTDSKTSFALLQPNGLRVQERSAPEVHAQLAWIDFTLPAEAQPGIWRLIAQKDGVTLRDIPVPVGAEATGINTSLRLIDRRDRNVTLAANIADAHDTPLPDRAATLRINWTNARHLPEISPDYAFGGYDNPEQQPQKEVNWVSGNSENISLQLPPRPTAPYPVQAQLRLEPWPAEKIATAQTANVTFPTHPWALGIKANFGDEPVPDGSEAGFKIALFKTAATHTLPPALHYELVTEHRSFRWFFANGAWDYHSDVAAITVAQGDIKLDNANKGQVGMTVPRGQYRLDVIAADRSLVSSWRFQVGTPDPPPTPPTNLALRINAPQNGKPQIATHGRGSMTMIAADTRLRAVQTDSGSAPREVAFTPDMPPAVGLNILTLAADAEVRGHGEIWMPPRTDTEDAGKATLHLPPNLQAGLPTKINAQIPPPGNQTTFAQIIAQPVAESEAPPLLTAALYAPQPRRFGWASNIIPPQPPLPTPAAAPITSPIAANSTRSAAVPVGTDGNVELRLPLPDRAGPVALHLLTWTATGVQAQIQHITLAPGNTATPPAQNPAPIFTTFNDWACAEPLTAKHPQLRLPASPAGKHTSATPVFSVLSPVALPNLPEELTNLLNPRYVRTETAAHALIALQDFSGILTARGIAASALQERRDALWQQIWHRQQGDGGIAAVPDSTIGDLSATALVVRAWHQSAPENTDSTRLDAMKKFLQRRLENPWNAENELPGRADGFYALSLFGQADNAALHYFVEKFGNALRDAVREAELAAALQQIQDQDKSRAFAARAQAQLLSLRHDDPGRVWQVLAILARHNIAPAEDLAAKAQALPSPAPQPWPAAVSLHARAAIARALPGWEVDRGGDQIMRERGVQGLFMPDKTGTQLRYKSGPPLFACTDHAPPARSNGKTTSALTRTFYTLEGNRLAATALRSGNRYILVISGKNWRTGAGELDIPLPSGLVYRTAIPGAAGIGTLKWLARTDAIDAAASHDKGVTLAIARDHDGDGRIAILVEARTRARIDWPPVTLTQSQNTATSAGGTLAIQ